MTTRVPLVRGASSFRTYTLTLQSYTPPPRFDHHAESQDPPPSQGLKVRGWCVVLPWARYGVSQLVVSSVVFIQLDES